MTDKQPNPSPRIYLAKRHRAWWHSLVRYERSRIVNEALDLYRAASILPETGTSPSPDCAADRAPSAPDAPREAS